jgi:hypothetical protein
MPQIADLLPAEQVAQLAAAEAAGDHATARRLKAAWLLAMSNDPRTEPAKETTE